MLLRIFIVLLVLILIPPIYLDRVIVRHRFRVKWRFLFFLPNILMLLAAIILTAFETYSPNNALLTNLFLTLFLGYIVSEALLAFFWALGRQTGKHAGWRNAFYAFGVLAAIGNLYIVIQGCSYGKYHTVTKHERITSPALPASFNGYKIVQLSDFHLGTYRYNPKFVQGVIKLVEEQQPDLIVFTGDMVNYNADELLPFMSELTKLKAKDGVVSVMGNHDYMTYIKWDKEADRDANIRKLQQNQQKMGWKLLLNEHFMIRRGSDSIAIIGVENDGKPPFPHRANYKKALQGVPEKLGGKPFYQILLSHDPQSWEDSILQKTNIQLTLSGHTHGGQLKIFGFAPIALFTDKWGGLYQEGNQKLYISTGLGEALLTFRYGIWPQIDVLTLQKKVL